MALVTISDEVLARVMAYAVDEQTLTATIKQLMDEFEALSLENALAGAGDGDAASRGDGHNELMPEEVAAVRRLIAAASAKAERL